ERDAGAGEEARQCVVRRAGAGRGRRRGARPARRGDDARQAPARSGEGTLMTDLRLDPGKAALLDVDVQERLWPAMDAVSRERVLQNLLILIETARRLRLPAVWSEQYPKGLGTTVPELASALTSLEAQRLEKVDFSCAAAPGFAAIAEN